MNTIDEILATGRYTDKRGREWAQRLFLRPNIRWANIIRDLDGIGWPGEKISDAQMRLLIERDLHRDVCPGLRDCWADHPRARVETRTGMYFTYGPLCGFFETMHDTLAEAIDVARALAVQS